MTGRIQRVIAEITDRVGPEELAAILSCVVVAGAALVGALLLLTVRG